MDQATQPTVSTDANGVPRNGMAGGNGRDAQGTGATGENDDFDQRILQRVNQMQEKQADGFRSVLDKRIASLEPSLRAVPQVQAQLNQVQAQLAQLLQSQQSRDEETLEPEEKSRRQVNRTFQELQAQHQQATMTANAYYHQNQVILAAHKVDVEWQDPEVNWLPDLFNQNPAAWGSAVMVNVFDVAKARREASDQRADAQRTEQERQRQAAARERQQAESQNARQADAAGRFSGATPEAGRTDASPTERLERVTDPKERRRLIDLQQRELRRTGKLS